ncbi:MAG: hypothetical protein HF973_03120 [Chloroflexi bacterium]|nr:hypothetical protein [Chloroflexota bacterium]
MEKLRADLNKLIQQLKHPDKFIEQLETLISVYPFNEYEYIISTLLGADILSLNDYYELRDEYIARNLYLYLFEISAPRSFGERWAQEHLKELVPDLTKPSRKLDPDYSGQYDFWLQVNDHKIRIEVKASRAVDFDSHEPLYMKALATDSNKRFDMNFQQIKPRYCDVFIWVGAWRDRIRYWILSSKEVENNKYYSVGQHRGNIGEGQLHIKNDNIDDFQQYEFRSTELHDAILNAYHRQISG